MGLKLCRCSCSPVSWHSNHTVSCTKIWYFTSKLPLFSNHVGLGNINSTGRSLQHHHSLSRCFEGIFPVLHFSILFKKWEARLVDARWCRFMHNRYVLQQLMKTFNLSGTLLKILMLEWCIQVQKPCLQTLDILTRPLFRQNLYRGIKNT